MQGTVNGQLGRENKRKGVQISERIKAREIMTVEKDGNGGREGKEDGD